MFCLQGKGTQKYVMQYLIFPQTCPISLTLYLAFLSFCLLFSFFFYFHTFLCNQGFIIVWWWSTHHISDDLTLVRSAWEQKLMWQKGLKHLLHYNFMTQDHCPICQLLNLWQISASIIHFCVGSCDQAEVKRPYFSCSYKLEQQQEMKPENSQRWGARSCCAKT